MHTYNNIDVWARKVEVKAWPLVHAIDISKTVSFNDTKTLLTFQDRKNATQPSKGTITCCVQSSPHFSGNLATSVFLKAVESESKFFIIVMRLNVLGVFFKKELEVFSQLPFLRQEAFSPSQKFPIQMQLETCRTKARLNIADLGPGLRMVSFCQIGVNVVADFFIWLCFASSLGKLC